MTLFDHAFVFLIAVVYPVAGLVGFRRLVRRASAGAAVHRIGLYRNTLIGHWVLFFALIAIWAAMARPWRDLGMSLDADRWFGVAALLTALGIAALVVQLRHVRAASQAQIDVLRKRFGDLEILIPRNRNELARFDWLSITAGIVEETLWRGYLIWYLGAFMPLAAAALISTVGFGIAHAYQGARHVPQVILLSAAFVSLYLLSGSLWLPMLLHAAVDILQGRLGHDVFNRSLSRDAGLQHAALNASSRK